MGVDSLFYFNRGREQTRYAIVFIERGDVNKCKMSLEIMMIKAVAVIMITQMFDIELKINNSILNEIGCRYLSLCLMMNTHAS